jgi:hypothetical protein
VHKASGPTQLPADLPADLANRIGMRLVPTCRPHFASARRACKFARLQRSRKFENLMGRLAGRSKQGVMRFRPCPDLPTFGSGDRLGGTSRRESACFEQGQPAANGSSRNTSTASKRPAISARVLGSEFGSGWWAVVSRGSRRLSDRKRTVRRSLELRSRRRVTGTRAPNQAGAGQRLAVDSAGVRVGTMASR